MIQSIAEFEKLAFKAITALSFERKCIYCAWCVNRLYASYAPLLAERLGPEVAMHTKACRDHLSKTIEERTFTVSKWYKDQHRMQRIDIEFELGVSSSEDCAMRAMTEALDNMFQFMATKKINFVMLMPLLSVEIIHTILLNEYGLDAIDIDQIIGHELLQKEFEAQLELLRDARACNFEAAAQNIICRKATKNER